MPGLEEMKAKRAEALAKLKESNPELAQKVEKIDSKLEEMRTAGVERDEAMASVKAEFGELSEPERAEMDAAFGTPSGTGGRLFSVKNQGMQGMGGGRPPGPPPAGGPGKAGGPSGASESEETSETSETDDEESLEEYLRQLVQKAVEEYKSASASYEVGSSLEAVA